MDQPEGSAAVFPHAAVPPVSPQSPVSRSDRVPVLAWVIGAVFVAVELAVSDRYGFLQDELYFIVAGHHLAFGYVDQPPLAPLLTRITDIFGVSPTAIRIIPALAALTALGQLRPYFASCRVLTTYYAPYGVHNDWTGIQIGVCTGPAASWRTLWPHLKHYD